MVPTIVWTKDMSVNVAEIDEQHRQLILIINKLNRAIVEQVALDILDEVFTELTDYARKHFYTEENYFRRLKFPAAVTHTEEHNGFINKLISFRNDFENGSKVVSNKIVEFLYRWLTEHIKVSDKTYTKLFNENGLL